MNTPELSDDEIELAHFLAFDAVIQTMQRVKQWEQDGFERALFDWKRELAACEALLEKLEKARQG